VIDTFKKELENVDKIVAIDSRWFLFGSALAYVSKKPLVIVRKKWKLPFKTICAEYQLEYWTDILEMHIDSIEKWDKVVIVDDVLATGWTAKAVIDLIEKAWWRVEKLLFLIELQFLNGKDKLSGYDVVSLIKY
jgi:adenine phosphoribosyltransferase